LGRGKIERPVEKFLGGGGGACFVNPPHKFEFRKQKSYRPACYIVNPKIVGFIHFQGPDTVTRDSHQPPPFKGTFDHVRLEEAN
jgi:hypothetical protein